jgi:hypothetical protein
MMAVVFYAAIVGTVVGTAAGGVIAARTRRRDLPPEDEG